MNKMAYGIAGMCLAAVTGYGATLSENLATVLALGDLTNAPSMYEDVAATTLATVNPGERKAVYFDALDYKGSGTLVYAYVGLPAGASSNSPVPGIVLVHGGGGTAFSQWVDLWTARGYAAISIAVEGQTDEPDLENGFWMEHPSNGPPRVGIYNDTDVEPITDQWMYHAVADTVLANSLLCSLPEVVATDVGLMGISWGGVITSTAIGIDDRFKFAVPTYGCGNLDESLNVYGATLSVNDMYKDVWDPMVRITNATMPVLWYSWPTDWHFALDSQADCYNGAPGQHMVSLVPGMGHGHSPAWNRPESYDFADSVIAGTPWCLQQSATLSNGVAEVVFQSTRTLDQAVLVSTIDGGHTGDRVWIETPSSLTNSGGGNYTVSATLPEYTSAWFINVLDGSLVASSDFQETDVVPSNIVYDVSANWSTKTVNGNDLVTIKNGATVTLDQSDETGTLTVNDDSGTTSTLLVNQDVDLTINGGGGLSLGAGTGAGIVTQSTGTVTTAALTVNSSGTGSLSQYNLSGGSLAANSVTVNDSGEINLTGGVLELTDNAGMLGMNNGGVLNINGGALAKDLLAPATNSLSLGTSGQTEALIQVQSGALQVTNGLVFGVIILYSKMEISGGDIDLEAQVRVFNEFKVIGNNASINFGWMGTYAGSDLVFELDAASVSPIMVSSWASLANAAITVDGSAYTGGATNMLLLDTVNLASVASANNITLTGVAGNGLRASVVQEQAPSHSVRLVIEEQAPETVIYNTTTNWSSQTVNDADEVIIRNGATVTLDPLGGDPSDLIVNGSFETPNATPDADPGPPHGFASVALGATSLTGWTVSGATVFVIDGFDQFDADTSAVASEGDQFVQLQYASDDATISQAMATSAGQVYELSFDYSALDFGSRSLTLTYDVGGAIRTVNMTTADPQISWATETFQFTATDTTTMLSFTGDAFNGFYGPSIDNVSVTAVTGASDTADTLVVNDDASPITATLSINEAFDLTVTSSIELGAGTGAGFVNQSTGTVTTAALTVNFSGTGDLSQYNLSGGSLDAAAVTVNDSAEMNMTGGTLDVGTLTVASGGLVDINGGTLDHPGNDTIAGGGLIKLQSGTFSSGTDTTDGQFLNANVEITGGTFSMLNQILFSTTGAYEFKVIGDEASITMRHLQFSGYTGSQGTLKWVLDETGVSTIHMTSWMFLDLAKIVVDGSAYTGGTTNIDLIDGVSINGAAAASNITVTGFAPGVTAVVSQNAGTGNVTLQITVEGYTGWALGYDLTGDDALPGTDVEPDGLDNLMEYALGGNPTNDDYSAVAPVSYTAEDGGANWFYYVHNQRTDDPALAYTLGTATNLMGSIVWNTNDVAVVGASAETDDIKSVTNRTEAAADAKFIDLSVKRN